MLGTDSMLFGTNDIFFLLKLNKSTVLANEERAAADLSGLRDHERRLIEVMINAAIQYIRQHD